MGIKLNFRFHITFTRHKIFFWFFFQWVKNVKLSLTSQAIQKPGGRPDLARGSSLLTLAFLNIMHNFWLYSGKHTSKWVWLNNTFCKRYNYIRIHMCVYIERWILMFSKQVSNIPGNLQNWPSEIESPAFDGKKTWKENVFECVCFMKSNSFFRCSVSYRKDSFFFLFKAVAYNWFSDEQH